MNLQILARETWDRPAAKRTFRSFCRTALLISADGRARCKGIEINAVSTDRKGNESAGVRQNCLVWQLGASTKTDRIAIVSITEI
jgi:hypothetical protein